MHHIDVPTTDDLLALAGEHGPDRVTLYLRTSPLPTEAGASRLELRNRAREAEAQLTSPARQKVLGELAAIADDEEFWREQCHGLAIFVSETTTRTFRLPHAVPERLAVADRFEIGALSSATAFPRSAFVLALSESTSRLVEVSASGSGQTVEVEGLPVDTSVLARTEIADRSAMQRPQGTTGDRIELQKYARLAQDAILPVVRPTGLPLIVASTSQLAHVYADISTYEHHVPAIIEGNPDGRSDADLAAKAEPILDEVTKGVIARWREEYDLRESQGRGALDVTEIARASIMGAVDSLMIDIEASVRGTLDESDASVHFTDDDAGDHQTVGDYSLLDEIAARVLQAGGTVLAVPKASVPRGSHAAAILRYGLS